MWGFSVPMGIVVALIVFGWLAFFSSVLPQIF